jgi:hypothetical protein
MIDNKPEKNGMTSATIKAASQSAARMPPQVSFSFMIPTIIFLGVLYASVSARFIFFRLFEGTRRRME